MPAAVRVLLAGQFGPVALHYTYRDGGEKQVDSLPRYIYLIHCGSRTILVDSSFSSPEQLWEKRGVTSKRLESERPLELLYQSGDLADEVDTLVYTHLHWDHAGNTHLFPRAAIVCQREEVQWLLTCPSWESGYDDLTREQVIGLGSRLQAVDGDYELCSGVKLVRLGGHSPGSQAVVVDTEAGKVIIPGDLVNTYRNIEEGIPCGIVHNLVEAWRGLELLKKEGDIVLPSHDWRTFERYGKCWIL